jgi:hypothetical protein
MQCSVIVCSRAQPARPSLRLSLPQPLGPWLTPRFSVFILFPLPPWPFLILCRLRFFHVRSPSRSSASLPSSSPPRPVLLPVCLSRTSQAPCLPQASPCRPSTLSAPDTGRRSEQRVTHRQHATHKESARLHWERIRGWRYIGRIARGGAVRVQAIAVRAAQRSSHAD